MKLETILDDTWSHKPFWLKAWIFLFTLFNRKEGKRLVSELIARKNELIQKKDEELKQRYELSDKSFEWARKEMSEKLSADEIAELNSGPIKYTVNPLQHIEFITDVVRRFDYNLSKIGGWVLDIEEFASNEYRRTAKIVIGFPISVMDGYLTQRLKEAVKNVR